MTAYLIELELWGDAKVAEITYAKRTPQLLTGVAKVRDVIGDTYYIPRRLEVIRTSDTLADALARAEEHVEKQIQKLKSRLGEIKAVSRA